MWLDTHSSIRNVITKYNKSYGFLTYAYFIKFTNTESFSSSYVMLPDAGDYLGK